MQEIEYMGIWWLPENSSKSITGILKYDPNEGAYLELMGEFVKPRYFSALEFNIILGKTSNGKDITLYKCFEKERNFSSNGFPTTVIFANIIFEGVLFDSEKDIKFNEISCRYSNLDEWTWMNGIDIDQISNDELEVRYKLPTKVNADINDEYAIEIYPDTLIKLER